MNLTSVGAIRESPLHYLGLAWKICGSPESNAIIAWAAVELPSGFPVLSRTSPSLFLALISDKLRTRRHEPLLVCKYHYERRWSIRRLHHK